MYKTDNSQGPTVQHRELVVTYTGKAILFSTGYLVITYTGKESKKVYIKLNPFAIHLQLMQH